MQYKGTVVIRYVMALLFLWFGYQQLTHTVAWVLFLPDWTSKLPISANLFVQMNGAMEVVLGLALLVGFFTRLVALGLGLHLMIIAISVGKDIDAALGVRDAALAATALALALNPVDEMTFDAKRKMKKASAPAAPAAPTQA